ncbi:small ribosomal subunit protein uS7-like [Watersipora subatra]|uniref:small ribosomal subunit protein uS7-like n=1 Tax=Watersipora subatra TaxID=2589382 RepID=UPI00355B6139
MAGGTWNRLALELLNLTKTCYPHQKAIYLSGSGHLHLTSFFRDVHTTHRQQSRYPKEFLEPIVNREELPSQKQDMGERVFLPVKAMNSTDKFACYHDPLVERFINSCMTHGHKKTAKSIVSKAFEKIKLIQLEKWHKADTEEDRQAVVCDPNKIFHQAFENVKPVFKLQRYIKAGTIYMVPVAAVPKESEHFAFRWLRDSSKNKDKSVSIWNAMAKELIDASQNTGQSVRRKQDLHRQCDQNKAYTHFIWSGRGK